MDELTQFLAMGGYAAFVWPAFGIVATLMAALFATSLRAARRSDAQVEALRSQRRGAPLDP